MSALDRTIEMWDDAIEQFFAGNDALEGDLKAWFEGFAGRGEGAVDRDAMPEPFLGPLRGDPLAVFLALNPGRSFPFQRRRGFFEQRVREAGSYSRWAAEWPYLSGNPETGGRDPCDWERVGQKPNRHHVTRLRFALSRPVEI